MRHSLQTAAIVLAILLALGVSALDGCNEAAATSALAACKVTCCTTPLCTCEERMCANNSKCSNFGATPLNSGGAYNFNYNIACSFYTCIATAIWKNGCSNSEAFRSQYALHVANAAACSSIITKHSCSWESYDSAMTCLSNTSCIFTSVTLCTSGCYSELLDCFSRSSCGGCSDTSNRSAFCETTLTPVAFRCEGCAQNNPADENCADHKHRCSAANMRPCGDDSISRTALLLTGVSIAIVFVIFLVIAIVFFRRCKNSCCDRKDTSQQPSSNPSSLYTSTEPQHAVVTVVASAPSCEPPNSAASTSERREGETSLNASVLKTECEMSPENTSQKLSDSTSQDNPTKQQPPHPARPAGHGRTVSGGSNATNFSLDLNDSGNEVDSATNRGLSGSTKLPIPRPPESEEPVDKTDDPKDGDAGHMPQKPVLVRRSTAAPLSARSILRHIRGNAWKVGRLLGNGSHGAVHAVEFPNGFCVAMKERSLQGMNDFEVRAMASQWESFTHLRHSNIAEMYAVETLPVQGVMRLWVELIPHGNTNQLARLLYPSEPSAGEQEAVNTPVASSPPSPFTRFENIARTMARQVLQGLAYLHANGVIHRDIKGSNILVQKNLALNKERCSYTFKLIDFDTAMLIPSMGLRRSRAPSVVGTPMWMAPEVLMGQCYSFTADVWSFGIALSEFLNGGHPPFKECDNNWTAMLEMGTAAQTEKGVDPQLPPHISAECRDFLLQCWCPHPNDRPSADELLHHPWLDRLRFDIGGKK